MPAGADCPGKLKLFQSAPDHSAGRCAAALQIPSWMRCFNPRPTIRPGDAAAGNDGRQPRGVSIRARPFGRAMLERRLPNSKLRRSFNPRPTIRPGDA